MTRSWSVGILATNRLARAFYDFVRHHGTGTKRFHDAVVGDLELTYEVLAPWPNGLTLTIYTAEPASPSDDALRLLAPWAASADRGSEDERLVSPVGTPARHLLGGTWP